MTIDFKNFIKTAEFKTIEDIKLAFSKCGNLEDVEELCWGNNRPNEVQFGEFDLVDWNEGKDFTVKREHYDVETGATIERYTFNFAEATEHKFTFEVSGNFKRDVIITATSEKEAEEFLEEALKNYLCLKQDLTGKVETFGDILFDEVTYDNTEVE